MWGKLGEKSRIFFCKRAFTLPLVGRVGPRQRDGVGGARGWSLVQLRQALTSEIARPPLSNLSPRGGEKLLALRLNY